MKGSPVLAHMCWWSTRGERETIKREEERDVLEEAAQRWGSQVLHVWDRGFAGKPWRTLVYVHAVRFVLKRPKYCGQVDEQQRVRKAWEITRGKRSL
jgi:hypothetical protein